MGLLRPAAPNIPNFERKRAMEKPMVFLPASAVFKPQKMIRMTRDVNGWVGGTKLSRQKWHLGAGKEYALDEEKAREFVIKGYAVAVGWEVKTTVTEIDETRGSISIIRLGDG